MSEEILPYGEHNRAFGVLSKSGNDQAPVIVMFNAGLLHRTEPYRLNVDIARAIEPLGFDSVRFDLSGKGDTPLRDGLSNRDSVALDWEALKLAMDNRLGQRDFILLGLCSGADNAIKTAAQDERVVGMILLDPLPTQAILSMSARLKRKITNPYFWLRFPRSVVAYIKRLVADKKETKEAEVHAHRHLPQQYSLRGLPTDSELHQSVTKCLDGFGVFCFFTSYSYGQYVKDNQLREGLAIPESKSRNLFEVYRPDVDHLFSLFVQRKQFVELLCDWLAKQNSDY